MSSITPTATGDGGKMSQPGLDSPHFVTIPAPREGGSPLWGDVSWGLSSIAASVSCQAANVAKALAKGGCMRLETAR